MFLSRILKKKVKFNSINFNTPRNLCFYYQNNNKFCEDFIVAKKFFHKSNTNNLSILKISKLRKILTANRRPWSIDDLFALFYGLFVSNIILVLLGTTSFVSVVIFLVNGLNSQEYLALKISETISKNNNLNASFNGGLEPHWKTRSIKLNNVKLKYGDKRKLETLWDLHIDEVMVTLSLYRMLIGKGIIKECYLRGIRGTIDRTGVNNSWEEYDPKRQRALHQSQFFEIENFQIEDLEITLKQPGNFRPYKIEIFNGNIGMFRKQWLLFDFFNAKSVVGLFDGSLFSVHCKTLNDYRIKQSQLRIERVNIDHLNKGISGPFGWITKGSVDFMININTPLHQKDKIEIKQIIDTILDPEKRNLSGSYSLNTQPNNSNDFKITHKRYNVEVNQKRHNLLDKNAIAKISFSGKTDILIDSQIRFNNIKASVPLLTQSLSLKNQAIVQPFVSYMNSNNVTIPLSFISTIKLDNFDGAWTIYDSELSTVFGLGVQQCMQILINDTKERNRQLKLFGYWGLQSLAKNLIQMFDYIRSHRKVVHNSNLL